MKLFIFEMIGENEKGKQLGELKIRKGLTPKVRNKKVMEYLEQEYNITIKNFMLTGSYSFATQDFNGGYVLFGDNLPFRKIKIVEVA